MRLPDTPEMKQIWNEIAPFLKITLKGMEIIEKGYEVIDGAPDDVFEKLEKYRHLRKEQWDFAESLNS